MILSVCFPHFTQTLEKMFLSTPAAISDGVENMEQYNMILLGYPIWHGQAPRIISTFLESYNFSGKTILPFCTSHSSGIGTSDTNLHSLVENVNWLDGRRFASGTTKEEIAPTKTTSVAGFDFESRTGMLNSGYGMPINGLETYSLHVTVTSVSVLSNLLYPMVYGSCYELLQGRYQTYENFI